MSIKSTIENHAVIFFLGVVVTGFLAGLGTGLFSDNLAAEVNGKVILNDEEYDRLLDRALKPNQLAMNKSDYMAMQDTLKKLSVENDQLLQRNKELVKSSRIPSKTDVENRLKSSEISVDEDDPVTRHIPVSVVTNSNDVVKLTNFKFRVKVALMTMGGSSEKEFILRELDIEAAVTKSISVFRVKSIEFLGDGSESGSTKVKIVREGKNDIIGDLIPYVHQTTFAIGSPIYRPSSHYSVTGVDDDGDEIELKISDISRIDFPSVF